MTKTLTITAGLLAMLALTGCAELQHLRQRTEQQELTIGELREENKQFREAYYNTKQMLDAERAESEKRITLLERDLEQARNLKTQEEKRLSDQLRRAELEIRTARDEAREVRAQSEVRVTQLQRELKEAAAERDAARERLTQLETRLTDEQAYSNSLAEQLAEVKLDLETTSERLATLEQNATQHQATVQQLTAERDTARKAATDAEETLERVRGQAADELEQNTARIEQLEAQLAESGSQGTRVAELEQQVAALTAARDNLAAQVAAAQKEARASLAPENNPTLKALAEKLAPGDGGGYSLQLDAKGLRVIIPTDSIFKPGSPILADDAAALLAPLGQTLADAAPVRIRVEGHTDNQPIRDLPFADNWGLGFARADRVRSFLMKQSGIAGDRLTALSRSAYEPLGDNATAEGRALNRRVELVILPPAEN